MTIQEIEQKLNECQKALAELKESKKEGKWKPQRGEFYWFRSVDGLEHTDSYTNDYDEWRINNIPIFPTKEACERYWHFMDTVKEKSYEFSKEEWEDDDIYKYSIEYDYEECEFVIDITTTLRYVGEIYFKSKEDVNYIIDNFKEELMEYWI